jgi:hypothetical protein
MKYLTQIATIADPKGIDVPIQNMQTYLATSLAKLEIKYVFGRAFRNNKNNGFVPEVYMNKGNTAGKYEYLDVFADTSLTSMVFFDVGQNHEGLKYGLLWRAPVNIIFNVDLTKWYTTLSYRAVEKVHDEVMQVLRIYKDHAIWNIGTSRIVIGIENVYRNYSIELLKSEIVDIHPYHLFSIETSVIYEFVQEECKRPVF